MAHENGVDIQHHLSQGITNELIQKSDLILVMSEEHESILKNYFPNYEEKIFLLKEFALKKKNKFYPNILDPIGQSKEFYKKIYQQRN